MMYLLEGYEMREIKFLVVAVEVDMDRHTLCMADTAYILPVLLVRIVFIKIGHQ
jgi:hypothetical protein